MFACLNGAYPRGSLPAQPERLEEGRALRRAGEIGEDAWTATADRAVEEVIREQEDSGLGILSDGDLRPDDRLSWLFGSWTGLEPGPVTTWPGSDEVVQRPICTAVPRYLAPATVEPWRFAASCTDLPVEQRVPGPYTLGWLCEAGDLGREAATLAFAEGLGEELRALAAAGCPMIQVDEDRCADVGDSPAEHDLLREAHHRLLRAVEGDDALHLCLAVSGGSVGAALPIALDLPYRSYLVDLVAAPDNWRLVAEAPADRGIICGIADASSPGLDATETVIWTVALAASGGRSPERVGVSPSGGMLHLRRERARRKIEVLGEATHVARMGPIGAIAAALVPDPAHSRIESLRMTWEAATAAGLRP